MTFSDYSRAYWRIPFVALLGAVLAFTGSFLIEPSYSASTRLLIHGRDATFLTSSGKDLSSQPGVIDSSLSKTLAETYGGIATSRSVATTVVDQLDLDSPARDRTGPVAVLAKVAAWSYRCGRAFITAGFCAPVDRYEKAVGEVQQGTVAAQLGSTAGQSAGQPGSYVLEVSSTGSTPEEARNITNSVADELVRVSSARFQESSQRFAQDLERQVVAAEREVVRQTEVVTDFKNAQGITDADEQQVLTATAHQGLETARQTAQADLAHARAQLASVDSALVRIPADQVTSQSIETGRSGTEISTRGGNPVHADLVIERSRAQAEVSGLEARIREIEQQLAESSPMALNGPQARLSLLQTTLDQVRANHDELTAALQEARNGAMTTGAELSRIDSAAAPTYPFAPKRYLYLALGLLFGGLAGGALTWLGRRPVDEPGDDDELDVDGHVPAPRGQSEATLTGADPLLVPATRGASPTPPPGSVPPPRQS